MKFIKFILTRGEPVTLSEEKAKAVLASKDPLVAITDDNGEWTGEMLHKAHIVQTVRDFEAERDWRREHTAKLPEPAPRPPTAAELVKISEIKSDMRQRYERETTT
jgi:hypothetical protein